MSARLEEMLRIAQAATKGFGGREWAASVATNQFRVAFNPRTAEALVKRQIALEKVAVAAHKVAAVGKDDIDRTDLWIALSDLATLTAAMEDNSNVG